MLNGSTSDWTPCLCALLYNFNNLQTSRVYEKSLEAVQQCDHDPKDTQVSKSIFLVLACVFKIITHFCPYQRMLARDCRLPAYQTHTDCPDS